MATGYVTDGRGNYLVQLSADNQFGFVLADDDQTWPGGFGAGFAQWHAVDADAVPPEDRERLGWLLDA